MVIYMATILGIIQRALKTDLLYHNTCSQLVDNIISQQDF